MSGESNTIPSMSPELEKELKEPVKPVVPEPIMQFFQYEHLPVHLQAISKPFALLANHIMDTLPRNPERTVALRYILQAKDCAVRAAIYKQ